MPLPLGSRCPVCSERTSADPEGERVHRFNEPPRNPYDNPFAESFIKALKVEAVHATEYETFTDVAADLPHFIDEIYNNRRLHFALGYISPNHYEETHAQEWSKSAA